MPPVAVQQKRRTSRHQLNFMVMELSGNVSTDDRIFFLKKRVEKLEQAIRTELSRSEFQRTEDGRCKYCGSIGHERACRVGRLESALSLEP